MVYMCVYGTRVLFSCWSSWLDTCVLIGVWLGEEQRTNTIETRVWKRLDRVFRFLLASPHSIVNTVGRTDVFSGGINEHAFPIILIEFEVTRISIWFLLMLRCF